MLEFSAAVGAAVLPTAGDPASCGNSTVADVVAGVQGFSQLVAAAMCVRARHLSFAGVGSFFFLISGWQLALQNPARTCPRVRTALQEILEWIHYNGS
jgi:hypothetical protein